MSNPTTSIWSEVVDVVYDGVVTKQGESDFVTTLAKTLDVNALYKVSLRKSNTFKNRV